MSRTFTLRIARSALPPDATTDARAFVDHELELEEGMTVLDALETLRGTREPGLRYRHSCHHGSCGTCGAIVNGREALMCLSRVADLLGTEAPSASDAQGIVTVEPLRKMTASGDLAVDPTPLFSSLPVEAVYLMASGLPHPADGLDYDGAPVEYRRFEACIECGLCVSSCPVPADRPFSGPAALAMADRDREERPGRLDAALAFAARPDGVAACDKAFACSRVCPQGVAPGRRIENLRKSLAKNRDAAAKDGPGGAS